MNEIPSVTLFLCGDVMSGRGIDQVLPHPGNPQLHEAHVHSAQTYVELAEALHGPVRRPLGFDELWDGALDELRVHAPALRIVNLETAVTVASEPWPGKEVHYRMHPDNVGALAALRIDACSLANNHVLDWGRRGLLQTLDVLHGAGIRTAGAGGDAAEASRPVPLSLPGGGHLHLLACATEDSGVPAEWAAARGVPGVNLLPDLSDATADRLAGQLAEARAPGDLTVLSIHWGGNWGYTVPAAQRAFAQRLVRSGAVDVVHGHSSHHPKGVEVHAGKLILYGCGDFVNDYEGIGGHGSLRPELGLMYFPTLARPGGQLLRMALSPTRLRGLRVHRANDEEGRWLAFRLDREGMPFGTWVRRGATGTFWLRWG